MHGRTRVEIFIRQKAENKNYSYGNWIRINYVSTTGISKLNRHKY